MSWVEALFFNVQVSERWAESCNCLLPSSSKLHLIARPLPSLFTKSLSESCFIWYDSSCRLVSNLVRSSLDFIPRLPESASTCKIAICIPVIGFCKSASRDWSIPEVANRLTFLSIQEIILPSFSNTWRWCAVTPLPSSRASRIAEKCIAGFASM